jgi:protein-tyrosine phosphatase
VIDIHSHILPGADDGSESLETSIKMLKIAQEDGIDTIFATPHCSRHYYSLEYQDVVKAVEELRKNAKENGISMNILPGQEISIERDALSLFREGKSGCLGDTRYMLLEMPFDRMDEKALDMIYELRISGVIPIIAHPERYEYIIKNPLSLNQLIKEGCLFQINSGSILGIFGSEIKKTADILVRHNQIHFIASDSHSCGKRSPRIKAAFDIIKQKDTAIFNNLISNSHKLLRNDILANDSPKIKEINSIFNFFKK